MWGHIDIKFGQVFRDHLCRILQVNLQIDVEHIIKWSHQGASHLDASLGPLLDQSEFSSSVPSWQAKEVVVLGVFLGLNFVDDSIPVKVGREGNELVAD